MPALLSNPVSPFGGLKDSGTAEEVAPLAWPSIRLRGHPPSVECTGELSSNVAPMARQLRRQGSSRDSKKFATVRWWSQHNRQIQWPVRLRTKPDKKIHPAERLSSSHTCCIPLAHASSHDRNPVRLIPCHGTVYLT